MLVRLLPALTLLAFALSTICADEKVPLPQGADALFKASDTDSSGKLEWKEVFKRWDDFNASLKIAVEQEDEIMERRVREFYADLLDPLDYLVADTDDDLLLSKNELLTWLTLDSEGKAKKPSRTDLETFSAAVVEAAWPGLLKLVDADQDNQISRAELKAKYPTDVDEKCFNKADKDGDGRLSQAEYGIFKVEEHQRGLFVEFDGNGGTVGGSGGTGAEAGGSEGEEPADDSKKTDAPDKRTEAGGARKSRLRVGTTWNYSHHPTRKLVDGAEAVEWKRERAEIASMTQRKDGGTDVVFKYYELDEQGEWVHDTGHSGGRELLVGKWAKQIPAAKDMVKITVKAGSFDCGVEEWDDYPSSVDPKRRGTMKVWTTYIEGLPLRVKMEFEGEAAYELLEFKE